MAAYLIANYDITDPDGFADYPKAAMQSRSGPSRSWGACG